MHFVIDGVEHSTLHVAGNCAYETTYGYVGMSRTAPLTLRAAISSGNAQRVWHRESQLVVLGVP